MHYSAPSSRRNNADLERNPLMIVVAPRMPVKRMAPASTASEGHGIDGELDVEEHEVRIQARAMPMGVARSAAKVARRR